VKIKRVLRYYCDHFRKGGCGKAAMIRHELHCIKNPQRECRMCALLGGQSTPMPELLEALLEDGLDGLRKKTDGCPACMLAAIVQMRISGRGEFEFDLTEFDYQAERTEWLRLANDMKWEGVALGGGY
jgi:hypothetical protein